jgi:hypothetical protein
VVAVLANRRDLRVVSGHCICQDPVFRDRYREKYGISSAESPDLGNSDGR